MMTKEEVKAILRVNGVEPKSSDEKIRSVLLSARYSEDEIDAAVMILRENNETKQTRVEGLHKVFRTNEDLTPGEVSQLLGVKMDLEDRVVVRKYNLNFELWQYVLLWLASVVLAVFAILYFMYVFKIGIFYPFLDS